MHFIKLKAVLPTEINAIITNIYWQELQPVAYCGPWVSLKNQRQLLTMFICIASTATVDTQATSSNKDEMCHCLP